eukprot:6212884-Pleurochrysis_carterae.AAC.2
MVRVEAGAGVRARASAQRVRTRARACVRTWVQSVRSGMPASAAVQGLLAETGGGARPHMRECARPAGPCVCGRLRASPHMCSCARVCSRAARRPAPVFDISSRPSPRGPAPGPPPSAPPSWAFALVAARRRAVPSLSSWLRGSVLFAASPPQRNVDGCAQPATSASRSAPDASAMSAEASSWCPTSALW